MIKKTDINTLKVTGDFSNDMISEFKKHYNDLKKKSVKPVIDLSEVEHAGTLAVAFLEFISRNKKIEIRTGESLRSEIDKFASESGYGNSEAKLSFLDRTVVTVSDFFKELVSFTVLSADIFYYSIGSVFNSSGRRKGSVFEQMLLMGNNRCADRRAFVIFDRSCSFTSVSSPVKAVRSQYLYRGPDSYRNDPGNGSDTYFRYHSRKNRFR